MARSAVGDDGSRGGHRVSKQTSPGDSLAGYERCRSDVRGLGVEAIALVGHGVQSGVQIEHNWAHPRTTRTALGRRIPLHATRILPAGGPGGCRFNPVSPIQESPAFGGALLRSGSFGRRHGEHNAEQTQGCVSWWPIDNAPPTPSAHSAQRVSYMVAASTGAMAAGTDPARGGGRRSAALREER